MQQQDAVLILHVAGQRGLDGVERDVDRFGKMAGVELGATAYIDDHGSALQKCRDVFGRDLARALQEKKDQDDDGKDDERCCGTHCFNFRVTGAGVQVREEAERRIREERNAQLSSDWND